MASKDKQQRSNTRLFYPILRRDPRPTPSTAHRSKIHALCRGSLAVFDQRKSMGMLSKINGWRLCDAVAEALPQCNGVVSVEYRLFSYRRILTRNLSCFASRRDQQQTP